MPKIKLNVTQDVSKPITKDILAAQICKLSDSISLLYNSGLNEAAILVLIGDSSKLSKRMIKRVLDSIAQLRADYTNV